MWARRCVVLVLAGALAVCGRQAPRPRNDLVPQSLDVASSEAVGEAPELPAPSAANATSLLSERERQSFLEWILSLTGGGTTTPEPEQEPVVPTKCSACTCGLTNKRTRIVGGQPVQVNQYVWMALLMYDGRFYCGGTLISSKYIMTASHCVDGFQRKKMAARLLEHDRATTTEAAHLDRKIARIIKHPGYSDVTFNNDIALLCLDKEVPFDDSLRPACLPATGRSFSGMDGIVTGWGVTTPGGNTNQVLHEVSVPIMSNKDCRKSNYGARRITDNMLCAGYPEGKKDSCQGDSGGPLHIANGTHHHVVGVVSWGEGCARPKYPGVYARVNRYLTWIKKNTKDSCFCDQQGNGFTHFPPQGAAGAGPAGAAAAGAGPAGAGAAGAGPAGAGAGAGAEEGSAAANSSGSAASSSTTSTSTTTSTTTSTATSAPAASSRVGDV